MNREIKGGQLFWGTFLLTGGLLFFGVKFDYLPIDWSFIWDIWPVTLILMGIIVILKNTIVKPVISIILGAFIAVVVFGVIADITYDDFDYEYHSDYSRSNKSADLRESWDETIEFVDLEVVTGASKIRLNDATSDLIKVDARGFMSDYFLDKTNSDNSVRLELGLVDHHNHIFDENGSNKLDIKLNAFPVWTLDFKVGAADSYLDLRNYKVRKVNLKTGASNTSIIIGDKQERIDLDISMGAAALKIKIPEGSGCKLEGDMVLFAKDLDGFNKIADNFYTTDNFDDAQNKIYVSIDGGVATLDIIKY